MADGRATRQLRPCPDRNSTKFGVRRASGRRVPPCSAPNATNSCFCNGSRRSESRRSTESGGYPQFGWLKRKTLPGVRTGNKWCAENSLRSSPGGRSRGDGPCFLAGILGHRSEHRGDRRDLGIGGVAERHLHIEQGCRRGIIPGSSFRVIRHSGMFPCFFGGRLARLVRSARSALMMATRVAAGSMMPSSSPRSAARNGEATL